MIVLLEPKNIISGTNIFNWRLVRSHSVKKTVQDVFSLFLRCFLTLPSSVTNHPVGPSSFPLEYIANYFQTDSYPSSQTLPVSYMGRLAIALRPEVSEVGVKLASSPTYYCTKARIDRWGLQRGIDGCCPRLS